MDTTHFGTSYRRFRHPFDSQDHLRRRKVVHNGALAADAPKPFLMGCYLKLSDFKAPVPNSGKKPGKEVR